jgi:hypothetical protein
MPSAVIRRYAWRPGTALAEQALDIEFTTGRVYRYHGVPENLVQEMRRWMSKGAFFNRRIRDHFPCEQLHGGWPEEGEPEPA